MESEAFEEPIMKNQNKLFNIIKKKVNIYNSTDCIKCLFEGFLKCHYETKFHGRPVTVEYSMTIQNNKISSIWNKSADAGQGLGDSR